MINHRKGESARVLLVLSMTGLVFWVLASGCSQPQPPQGQPMTVAPGASHEGAAQAPELSFTVPEGWIQEQPSSAMRHSQYRLPGPDTGGDAELAVFAGIGGSVQANVDRWIAQFTVNGQSVADSAKVDHRDISGYHITFVDVSGDYDPGTMSAPMGAGDQGPRSGYRMLAAVVETSGRPWFLKLTGPEQTVAKWQASFEQHVASVK